jgi:hypothetical protein
VIIESLRQKIAEQGLSPVVANRLRRDGFKIAGELDIKTMLTILGHKIYEKNAEYRRIIDGLQALRQLQEE